MNWFNKKICADQTKQMTETWVQVHSEGWAVLRWPSLHLEIISFITKERSSGSPSFVQSTRSSWGWAVAGHVTTPSIPVGRYVCWGIWRAWAGSEQRKEIKVFYFVRSKCNLDTPCCFNTMGNHMYWCRETAPWFITSDSLWDIEKYFAVTYFWLNVSEGFTNNSKMFSDKVISKLFSPGPLTNKYITKCAFLQKGTIHDNRPKSMTGTGCSQFQMD